MKIFKTYTGNAMLNNALMTIEALSNLNDVSEITPELLFTLFKEKRVRELNKRLKSYTMVFSLNNPLVNPQKKKENAGEITYKNLIHSILKNYEEDGEIVCEISGLRFNKTFRNFYEEEIEKQKANVKEKGLTPKEEKKHLKNLDNTDFSMSRTWFPLIGGLGSDAQALPQAKFSLQIHPICIVIIQFLPLSSLLYKGGILVVDSSNFEFTRGFIENNVKEVEKRIQVVSSTSAIENIKDFAKGSYLLKAIEILEEKEIEDEYSDLNLWSFSNSGTGASCEIERIPNSLVKKLMRMKHNTSISREIKSILGKKESSYSFLESLEDNKEWYLLYPNIFGTGKKKVEYEGVSVAFLESFFKEITSSQKTEYASYLAYLIDKYKSISFAKYLSKVDAWKEQDYKADLYAVLVKATENGEWSLMDQLEILDNTKQVPIRNNFFNILKITHFYYQKKAFNKELPQQEYRVSVVRSVCEWLITHIQNDDRKNALIEDLLSPQKYLSVNYNNVFYRASQHFLLDLNDIHYALYDERYRGTRMGVNGLLRIFFSQGIQEYFENNKLEKEDSWSLDKLSRDWFEQLESFAKDYQTYYFDKYENKEMGTKPYNKFLHLALAVPYDNSKFILWLNEAIENTNKFLKAKDTSAFDKWSDDLLYSPQGEFSVTFSKFAIKFLLLKQYHSILNTGQSIIS